MSTLNPYSPPNPQPEDDPPLVAQLAVEGEGMTVEFEQTLEDLLTMQDFHIRQQSKMSPSAWVLAGVMAAGLIGFLSWCTFQAWQRGEETMLLISATSLLAVLWIVFRYLGYRRWLVRRWTIKQFHQGRNLNLTGIRRVTITPEFLISASPLAQSVCRWQGVEKVQQDERAIYIYVSTMNAHVLPRRAFNSDLHFREFAATAEKYRSR